MGVKRYEKGERRRLQTHSRLHIPPPIHDSRTQTTPLASSLPIRRRWSTAVTTTVWQVAAIFFVLVLLFPRTVPGTFPGPEKAGGILRPTFIPPEV